MIVAAVVVTYNGKKWIEKCIDHLLMSDVDLDIIVVDNCSSDGTKQLLKTYTDKIQIFELEENLGFGRANNVGIAQAYNAGAEYVFLVNQDVYVTPNTISLLISAAANEPQYGIISPMHLNGSATAFDRNFLQWINDDSCPGLLSDIYLQTIKPNLYETQFVNAAAWLITRRCLATVGGFNPNFLHYSEDDNYIMRAKFHNLKVGILPTISIRHDRESRARSVHFADDDLLYKRILVTKASDPFAEMDLKKERSKLIKNLLKATLRLDKKAFAFAKNRIRIFNNANWAQLSKSRTASMQAGATFIN